MLSEIRRRKSDGIEEGYSPVNFGFSSSSFSRMPTHSGVVVTEDMARRRVGMKRYRLADLRGGRVCVC